MVALAVNGASADTPASQVSTQTVQAAQSYPVVPAKGEAWFDVGGFCKVVDVGDLSVLSPPADGIPVFVPGPADQWENYRTSAPANASYAGRLTLTTCCRPQTDIATLCANTANPQPVSREYGRLGEADTVSANCVSTTLGAYTETMTVTCNGDDGPDGQASWEKTADTGAPAGPQCPATPITWEEDTYGVLGTVKSVKICSGTLPATSAPVFPVETETIGTAVQVATAANGFTNGSISAGCTTAAEWDYGNLRLGKDFDFVGSCFSGCPATNVSWTVSGYTCQGPLAAGTSGQTETAYTLDGDPADNGPLTVGGVASYTCGADGIWTLDPGDTCGPGQCVPEPGVSSQTCLIDCFLEQYDSCGNRTDIGQCGSCAACTPTAGSCSCTTNTDSCGNSCTPTGCGGTSPSGGGSAPPTKQIFCVPGAYNDRIPNDCGGYVYYSDCNGIAWDPIPDGYGNCMKDQCQYNNYYYEGACIAPSTGQSCNVVSQTCYKL